MGEKSLYRAARIFEECLAWKIGNGRGTLANNMAWVNGRVLEAQSNQRLEDARKWRVEDFIDPTSRNWKIAEVRNFFELNYAKEILGMELPRNRTYDFIYWKAHPTGNFTIKLGYAWLVGSNDVVDDRLDEADIKLIRMIWRLPILSKWKFITSKLMYNGLAVNSNLSGRGIGVDPSCGYYGHMEKDTQHIFRLSTVARLAWNVCSLQVQPKNGEPIDLKKCVQRYIFIFYSENGVHSGNAMEYVDNEKCTDL